MGVPVGTAVGASVASQRGGCDGVVRYWYVVRASLIGVTDRRIANRESVWAVGVEVEVEGPRGGGGCGCGTDCRQSVVVVGKGQSQGRSRSERSCV